MPGPYKYLINVSHHHISLTHLFSFPVFLPSVPGPINHLRNPQACLISLPHLYLHRHSPPGRFSSPCPFHWECLILIVYTLQLAFIITFSRSPPPFSTLAPQIRMAVAVTYLKCESPRHFPLPCSEKKILFFPITYFPSSPSVPHPQQMNSSLSALSPSSGSSNSVSCYLWLPLHPDSTPLFMWFSCL